MRRFIVLVLTLSFSMSLFADEVKYIRKGALAPFDGYVFDMEAESRTQRELMERDNFEKQVKLYQENEKIYEEQVKQWKGVAIDNTERLVKLERNTFWQNTLYFGLGVILTGALAIGLSKGVN